MVTILDSKTCKAIKQHICFWCNRPINVGETYKREVQIIEGRLYTFKSHQRCAKLVVRFFSEYEDLREDGLSSEDFMQLVREKNIKL